MLRSNKATGVLVALSLSAAMPAAHAQRSDAEGRLREMLRQTTIELRDAQNQNAQLRSQLDELNAQRTQPVEKKPAASPDAGALRRAQQEASELRREIAELRRDRDAREQTLARLELSSEQAELLARAREADSRQLNDERSALNQRFERCARDNGELVGIADELLQRYRNKGVWESFRDSEPLIGIRRVKLETLAQQYHARILDLKTPSAHGAQDAQPSQ
jgi:hypothetical protein